MKAVGKVYETSNYSQFKKLSGNRDVEDRRVNKITKSINKVGQMISPIIVNKNMEVIDGQARLEAFKRLGLPVYFYIDSGADIDECIQMNVNQSNWKQRDYIFSWAERGAPGFDYLKQLYIAYHSALGITVIFGAIRETYENKGTGCDKRIQDGSFRCTIQQYEKAVKKLDTLMEFLPYVRQADGPNVYYMMGLLFCISVKEVDMDLLLKKVSREPLVRTKTVFDAIEKLESIYNYRNREKVYISTEYKKWRDSKH